MPQDLAPHFMVYQVEPHIELDQLLEIEGNLLEMNVQDDSRPLTDPHLGFERDDLLPVAEFEASRCIVGYGMPDSMDYSLWIKVIGKLVRLRVGNTLIDIDLNHVDQPAAPVVAEIGGEA